jgi:hypothetical protein
MIQIKQYKQFVNSADFDKIFNQSVNDLARIGDVKNQLINHIKPALDNSRCFLLYKDDKIIGYEVCFLEKNVINGGFTYIVPDHRKCGHSYLLREQMWSLVKNECGGEIKFMILNSNKNSLESAKKTAAKMGFSMVFDQDVIKHSICVAKIWKLSPQ